MKPTSNNKISTILNTQVPFFIREDHPKFVEFLKSYYKYMEEYQEFSSGRPVERILHHLENIDIDNTDHDEAADYLYRKFINDIPVSVRADRKILLKNIKDFYRRKGTEKATKFLIYALTGYANTEIYYPKRDILKVSDGKWYIQKSLRVANTWVDGNANSALSGLSLFVGRRVTGNTSNASALVESVERFYYNGSLVDELVLSNIDGDFQSGERVWGSYIDPDNQIGLLLTDIYRGGINSVIIVDGGTGYNVGDPVTVTSNTGSNANIIVASVSTGTLETISVANSGAGFMVNDNILMFGGGGTNANAVVTSVDTSEQFHPNTYTIYLQTPELEANTPVGNTIYSNLNSILVDPANSAVINSLTAMVLTNVGPVFTASLVNIGSNYSSLPTANIVPNTALQSVGILGRMEIISGGENYHIGDELIFIGGDGHAATGNVTNVGIDGTITEVKFQQYAEDIYYPIGGFGYSNDNLPTISVSSNTGTNANIVVITCLGDGETFTLSNNRPGIIESVEIIDGGSGYTVPTINMASYGDGTANLIPSVLVGVYTYPGRYLNDDGFLSSYNFLQDRDFYQTFSYVLKTGISMSEYYDTMTVLGHPAGMKMFGEFEYKNLETASNASIGGGNTQTIYTSNTGTYTANIDGIFFELEGHAFSNLAPVGTYDNLFIEFDTGELANSIYDTRYFTVNEVTSETGFSAFPKENPLRNLDETYYYINTNGLYFANNGSTVYMVNGSNIIQYRTEENYLFSNIANVAQTTSTQLQTNTISGICLSVDANVLYVVDSTDIKIRQFDLTNNGNVSTATVNTTLNIANSISPFGIRFNEYGNTFYIGESTSIFQYDLSSPWDLNTASFTAQTAINTYNTISNFSYHSNTIFNINNNTAIVLPFDSTVNTYSITTVTGNATIFFTEGFVDYSNGVMMTESSEIILTEDGYVLLPN